MRANRQINDAVKAGVNPADIPYVPTGPPADFVQCPTCGRHFNQTAGERHIPQCKNIRAKPTMLKRGGGLGGGNLKDKKVNPKAGQW